MSMRFPARNPRSASAAPADLRLHTPIEDIDNRDGLAWVRWLFQSVRAQRTALVFQTDAIERAQALAEWQCFVGDIFFPVLAPALLRGWRAAHEGDDAA